MGSNEDSMQKERKERREGEREKERKKLGEKKNGLKKRKRCGQVWKS